MIFDCGAYEGGVKSSLVPARKPAIRSGRYCIRLSRDLTSAVSWVMSCLARLARDRLYSTMGATGFGPGAMVWCR